MKRRYLFGFGLLALALFSAVSMLPAATSHRQGVSALKPSYATAAALFSRAVFDETASTPQLTGVAGSIVATQIAIVRAENERAAQMLRAARLIVQADRPQARGGEQASASPVSGLETTLDPGERRFRTPLDPS